MTECAEWDSFYLIIGSAAGALIGLQFVVMTLAAARVERVSIEMASAFATPTIIHFGAALLLALLIRAPLRDVTSTAIGWGVVGVIGVIYSLIVIRRMRGQGHYRPEFEDWLFHALLPLAAYATLAASALTVPRYGREALFAIGASVLTLLFVGIHNAWDAVTYHIFMSTVTSPPTDGSDEMHDVADPAE